MRARWSILVACLCAGLAVLVSGCGSGGGTSSTEAAAPSSVPSATLGMPVKIQNLDPDLTFDAGNQALHFIGGTLFNIEEGKAVPGLASSAHVSSNELTWTIKLKPGLKFSDGTPLRSSDVKATFDRAHTDKNNINAFLWTPIKSVEAPNPTTVIIRLSRPYPSLQQILGYPFMAIFPADRINQKGFFNEPISAGPYKLTSWGGGNTAVFETNPNYAGSPAVISKLTMSTIPDPNTRLSQVSSGQLQLAYALPPNLIPQINSPAVKQVQQLYGLDMMSMQTKKGPLDELGVRQAISEAINRQQLSEIVWGGEAEPLAQVWPSTMAAHDSSIPTDQNLAAAKKSLAGTSCANGCNLQLTYSQEAYPQQEQEAPIIKSNLEEIGIKVSLNNVDPATFFESAFTLNFDLMLTGLYDFADIPDSICSLGMLPILQTNFTGFELPGIEKACTEAMSQTGAARIAAMREVSEILMKYVPWTPLTGMAHVDATSVPETLIKVQNTLIGVAHKDGKVW
ncbi:MAG: ABC transporter substrate-binding protein [Actinobacteria bacterium]|nr:ABC transporter substrate-binding protein [Actinomycetota bacterium]